MSESTQLPERAVGGLVVTHGNLARELVIAAKKIVGEASRLRAVCIAWEEEVNSARQAIATAIDEMQNASGIVIMTDMFGGTPTNISLTFLESGRVEIVTGVNLPMLVKFLSLTGTEAVGAVAEQLTSKGQQSIQTASGILNHRGSKGGF